jgi:hypothetical protein
MYVSVLESIQQQIGFADLKAGFLATLNAVLFGFLAPFFNTMQTAANAVVHKDGIFWLAVVLQGLYLGAMGISIGTIVLAVMPRFSTISKDSVVFFGAIVKRYGNDCGRFVSDTSRLTDQQWAEQLGSQIVEISHIATKKHRLVRQAVWSTLFAFAFWRASLFVMMFLPLPKPRRRGEAASAPHARGVPSAVSIVSTYLP